MSQPLEGAKMSREAHPTRPVYCAECIVKNQPHQQPYLDEMDQPPTQTPRTRGHGS